MGTRVTCLKGVYVAENSIVAATSTINKRYEQKNSIIAGVPAKIVKSGINWSAERIPVESNSDFVV
jgi:acetyltransferase-like isoleucine patch superfamily enzyme